MKTIVGNSDKIRSFLTEKPQYRECLFSRGYFITEDTGVNEMAYPFYSLWEQKMINGYKVLIHKDQDFCIYNCGEITFLMIGHAYNPFSETYEEEILLSQAAEKYCKSKDAFFEQVSEWTGIFCVFVFDDELIAVQDAAGIKAVYYGEIGNRMCFMSHPQMAADIYRLDMDPFVKKLINNRFYNVGNRYLPGDISPYKEIKRIGANVYLRCSKEKKVTIHRFYPVRPLDICKDEEEYVRRIEAASSILQKNIELIAKKWPNSAISLSGGTDSKTTLACANGLYDRFRFFSFQSKDSEITDSDAAHKICEKIGLHHSVYPIPANNEDIEDYEDLKRIINHSNSYIQGFADNEIRKYICMYRWKYFDTEVKSWCSEIVRVFFERKYGMRFPERLSPRYFSVLQTRYFASPILLYKSDRIYKEYMEKFDLVDPKFNFEHTDIYYWEVRMSNWGMLVTQSLDLCHRVTFPFNNRKLIELMLTLPREERKSDRAHNDIINLANETIGTTNIHILNNYFHTGRILLEHAYLKYRTLFRK